LVGPPVPDSSKCRDQTKCSPCFSRFGVWRGAKDPIPEKLTYETTEDAKRQGFSAIKEEEDLKHHILTRLGLLNDELENVFKASIIV
jgi:hypothetical protein